jgi:hypothetical protein
MRRLMLAVLEDALRCLTRTESIEPDNLLVGIHQWRMRFDGLNPRRLDIRRVRRNQPIASAA